MKRETRSALRVGRGLVGLIALMLFVAGCSWMDAPTAPQDATESHGGLWNPQPGDEIIPGQEVPLLNPGYWEGENGYFINPSQNSASAVIGSAGGQLRLGRHRLVVPAGAVNNNVTFTMAYASESGVGVDCYPSGRQFQVPVTLTLSFKDTQYDCNNCDPSGLAIFFLPDGGSPQQQPSNINITDKTVSADLTHFSRYIIG